MDKLSYKQNYFETPYNTRHNTSLHAVPCNLSRDPPPSFPTPGGIGSLVGPAGRSHGPTNFPNQQFR